MTMEIKEQSNDPKVEEAKDFFINKEGPSILEMAKKTGSVVLSSYVTIDGDVIARKDANGNFRVALEAANKPDWWGYMWHYGQSYNGITATGYFGRVKANGLNKAQNIITPWEDGIFKEIRDMREKVKLPKNPNLTVFTTDISHVEFPPEALDGRQLAILTTYSQAASPAATEFKNKGVYVVGTGVEGVDGEKAIDFLVNKLGQKIITNTTGPRILDVLLKGNQLDLLYITHVNRKIDANPKDVQTVLPNGQLLENLPGFERKLLFHQEGITTADGTTGWSQDYWVYQNKDFLKRLGA